MLPLCCTDHRPVNRWALTNPHMSLHIPNESRIVVSKQKKSNGRPRRPVHSMKSIMSNIHILTGVASFVRWPLNLHIFAKEAQKAWETWIKQAEDPERPGLHITTDIVDETTGILEESEPAGIHALDLDYTPIKEYVQKARDVVSFEREGSCVHCADELTSKEGLQAMCPNTDCRAMGHLACWSKHALAAEGDSEAILPSRCRCPSCGGEVRWGDMMKELTLRVRGEEDVQRLLTVKKRAKRVVHE